MQVNRKVIFSQILMALSPSYSILQVLLIDGRGHLLGRLAALVAKQVLLGKYFTFLGVIYECCLLKFTIQSSTVFSEAAGLPQSVDDDELSVLLEFNDHEKTHMHYHLRQIVIL